MSKDENKDQESIRLDSIEIEKDVLSLVSEDMCRRIPFIPIARSDEFLTVAMANPTDTFAIEDIQFVTRLKIKPLLASKEDITSALDKYFETRSFSQSVDEADEADEDLSVDVNEESKESGEQTEGARVVILVNSILRDAIKKRASHIHIEPKENTVRVRYRIDGVLRDVLKVPPRMKNAMRSRMKIISNLSMADTITPQDGMFGIKFDGKSYKIVSAALPTIYGERIVLQLPLSVDKLREIEELGFSSEILTKFKHAIGQPSGLVLVTGPRGSGKKTTMYTALSYLNSEEVNILTIENPINFVIEGVGQSLAKEDYGLTYATALDGMMRQDPDIIMVQEIRDLETAQKVIQIALERCLILSAMDSSNAPMALFKLLDLGISPSMINASVGLILSQRLVRKICENCKVESPLTQDHLESIKEIDPFQKTGEWSQKDVIYSGKGCNRCSKSGYHERIPVCETLVMSPKIKQGLINKASHDELRKTAIEEDMITMAQDALKKAKSGETTMDECLRIFSMTDK
jgi:type IV pilus assembly protein PilB